jgi:ribosome biogenesis GTPase
MKLEDLGYNDFFELNRIKLGLDDFLLARVTSEYKGFYKLKNETGEYLAKITGKQMFDALAREDYPAVGDWVAMTMVDDGKALIHHVLPRMTIMKRRSGDKNRADEKNKTQIIATNIDVAFVVESVDRDFNLNRLERYFAIARNGGVKPVVVLNKIDLIDAEELNLKLSQLKNRLENTEFIPTSTKNDDGMDLLKKYIVPGRTYCFLGSSGTGKSSLINKLLGKDLIKTGDISAYSGRGKHTTTNREMYFLENGGIVIDNPGMREVGLTDINEGVEKSFEEIVALAQNCKYVDCSHTHEPGCEILKAVESGKIDKEKYANYLNLNNESRYYEMNEVEKKEKDRRFGKYVKKAKKQLKNYGFKDY